MKMKSETYHSKLKKKERKKEENDIENMKTASAVMINDTAM